jgi:O-antigen/teichoic acid export membrane protein
VGSGNDEAVPLVRLFFVWLALGAFDAVVTPMLTSLGRLKPMVWLSTAWVAANLALSIILVDPLGAKGVLVGTVVTYAPLIAAFTQICLKEVGVGRRTWARRVLLPQLPAVAVQVGLCLALYYPLEGLPDLVTVALAMAIVWPASIAAFARFGLPPAERAQFMGTLRGALTRSGSAAST